MRLTQLGAKPQLAVQRHARARLEPTSRAHLGKQPTVLSRDDVTHLQREAGSRAVADFLAMQRQATDPAAPVGMVTTGAPAASSAPPAPPNIDWIDALDDHIKGQIDTYTARDLDEANAAKHDKLLDKRRINRETFVRNMAPYVGGEAALQTHFTNIERFDGTELWAHISVLERLQEVQTDLKSRNTPMPSTDVGLGLRGRHLHPQGLGKMMHPLGFAVDWKAYAAPHVTDKRLHTLFETVSGGPAAFHLSLGGKSLGKMARLDLIEQMGKGIAEPDKARQLLASVESEYKRLSKASADFKVSLPESSLAPLREVESLRKDITTAEKVLKKAAQKLKVAKKKDKAAAADAVTAAAAALAAVAKAFADKKADVAVHLETIFKPWLTELDSRAVKLDAAAKAQGVDLRAAVTTDEHLGYLGHEIKALAKLAEKPERKAKNLLKEVHRTDQQIGLEVAGIEANLAGMPDRDTLMSIAEPLVTQSGDLERALLALMPNVKLRSSKGRARKRSANDYAKALAKAGGSLAHYQAGYTEIKEPLGALRTKQKDKGDDLRARQASNTAVAGKVGKAAFEQLQKERKRLFWLEETAKSLRTDINFVIPPAKDVNDPGITQLLGLLSGTEGGGFFTPDPETGGEEEAAAGAWSHSHGFNLEFFKSMVSHGFELAVAWEETPDTMHFELVEGRKFATSGGAKTMVAGTHSH